MHISQDPRRRTRQLFAGKVTFLIALTATALLLYLEAVPNAAAAAVIAGFALAILALATVQRYRIRTLFMENERTAKRQLAAESLDDLTRARNRGSFIHACEEAMKACSVGGPGALFLIDMDYLKRLNDAYGHDTGDAAICRIADVLRATAGRGFFGRLGGDEFALFVPVRTPFEATALAGEIKEELSRTVFHQGWPFSISASIGIATCVCPEDTFAELSQKADLALYESKRNGRGQSTVFDPEMMRDRRHVRFIQRELRAAILMNELELAYQPLVGFDGAVVGCEALVRWRHPVRGTITPGEFIPVAEQSNLIDMLGQWVVRRACRDVASVASLPVNVNVSISQLRRDEILQTVARALDETGLDPSRLTLEITESAAMTSEQAVIQRIQALRELGVRIALDDFGSGHSGFSYLKTFPVDTIKIDRSFVSTIAEKGPDKVIFTAIAQVARAMNIATVAEGVETQNQARLAHVAGCSIFQGFYYARPESWKGMQARCAALAPAGAAAASVRMS